MKCYDAAERLDLVTGETRSFTLDWSDYLTPGQTLSSIASIGVDEPGGPSVIASSVQAYGRSTRVRLTAGNAAGDYSLTILAAVTERGQTNITPAIRILVKVSDPAPVGAPLEMRLGDTKRFTIPFDNWLAAGEKIVGILLLVIDRDGGGTISGAQYSNDGKRVGFAITNPTAREDYQISAVVSVQNQEGTLDVVIATVALHVC